MYVADFETTTNPCFTEVWLSAFKHIDDYNNEKAFYQTSIKEFFIELYKEIEKKHTILNQKEYIVFFHNLKFDGSFIVNYLMSIDYPHETYISDMGVWYSITVKFQNFKIVFRDSLKILNFSISQMAKIFKMSISKGETPLLNDKPQSIKKEWYEYILTDINILAKGIYTMYKIENFSKFTSASEALHEFKSTINYREVYPILEPEIDTYLRKAYKGGYVMVKDSIKGKIINKPIVVYDINSMYPAQMLYKPLPFGTPKFCKGKPENLNQYMVLRVLLNINLKKGFLPTLQTKDTKISLELGVKKTDYIKTTNGLFYEFYLTNFDLQLVLSHYETHIDYLDYYIFETNTGMFDPYINYFKELKENAKTEGEKQKAKIMLNSLYGKFGSKIESISKIPYLEDGINRFERGEPESVEPNYIPLAIFITSLARHYIITSAQQNYDKFLYCDTDSLHLIDDGKIPNLDIHKSKFGLWKLEGNFIRGKYLRPKLYIEEDSNGKIEVKGAGMTNEIKKQINFDNFKFGSEFMGKKSTKQTKGGMIIYETTFKISENDFSL